MLAIVKKGRSFSLQIVKEEEVVGQVECLDKTENTTTFGLHGNVTLAKNQKLWEFLRKCGYKEMNLSYSISLETYSDTETETE